MNSILLAANAEVRSSLRGLLYASLEEISTFFERYVPPPLVEGDDRPESKGGGDEEQVGAARDQDLFYKMLRSLSLPEETVRRREEVRARAGSFLAKDVDEVSLDFQSLVSSVRGRARRRACTPAVAFDTASALQCD